MCFLLHTCQIFANHLQQNTFYLNYDHFRLTILTLFSLTQVQSYLMFKQDRITVVACSNCFCKIMNTIPKRIVKCYLVDMLNEPQYEYWTNIQLMISLSAHLDFYATSSKFSSKYCISILDNLLMLQLCFIKIIWPWKYAERKFSNQYSFNKIKWFLHSMFINEFIIPENC